MRSPVLALAVAVLATCVLGPALQPVHALPDEFEGFLHYRHVDASVDEVLLDASSLTLSPEVWSAVCEEIERCVAFNNKGFLKAFPYNETVDSYISKENCGAHGKADQTKGSCLKQNSTFVHCHDDRGNLDTFYVQKAVYPLPPHLVADACRRDPSCAGFLATQNRQIGVLLVHFQSPPVTDIWTRVPHRNTTTVTAAALASRGPYRLRPAAEW